MKRVREYSLVLVSSVLLILASMDRNVVKCSRPVHEVSFQNIEQWPHIQINGTAINQNEIKQIIQEKQQEMEKQVIQVQNQVEWVVNFGAYYLGQLFKTIYEMDYFNPFKRSLFSRLQIPDDAFRSFHEICHKYGYASETHKVITKDGYINTIHRIRNTSASFSKDFNATSQLQSETLTKSLNLLSQDSSSQRNPVLFMTHGILDSSDAWILNGRDKSLAFMAADAGFDVWLPNTRGNKYSSEHVFMDSRFDKAYWDHSFVEIARYDMPAFYDYVRNYTRMPENEKLSLVTHSQSTTVTYYGMSKLKKYYSDNVDIHVAIAPVARITHASPVNLIIKQLFENFAPIIQAIGFNQIFDQRFSYILYTLFCGFETDSCLINMSFTTTGSVKPINYDGFRVFWGHYPSGSSIKCLMHFIQILNAKRFQEYDYGPTMNRRLYGTVNPPEIDISSVGSLDIDQVMVIGKDDTIAYPEDSYWIKNQIGSRNFKKVIEEEGGHNHFFFGNNAKFFEEVLTLIKQTKAQALY